MSEKRLLSDIAREIRGDWANVGFAAKPYLFAMSQLDRIEDRYIRESGEEIVIRFLCNASGWRGETARRVKVELQSMLNKAHEERTLR